MLSLNKNSFIRKKRFWNHFFFWFFHFIFFSLLGGVSSGNYEGHFLSQLVTTPIKMCIVYFVLYVLLPKYLQHYKYFYFFIGLILLCFGSYIIFHVLNYYFIAPVIFKTSSMVFQAKSTPEFLSFNPSILWMIFITSYLTVLAMMIKLIRIWHGSEKRVQQELNHKLEAELKYLKAQIHPHFLFNTLNNLYTLALKKSDKAPEAIDKLAGLLRYMSYDASQKKVSLEKDIENLKNYVSLEKMRYDSRLSISMEITGDIKNRRIAPLILLPFIENSFKHGVSGEISDCWINISINVVDSTLKMRVKNSIADLNNDLLGSAKGIGHKNAIRRLELIYKDKFELELLSNKSYMANLTLDLS